MHGREKDQRRVEGRFGMHAHTPTRTHARMHAHMPTRKHARTHAHTHTCTHAHTHVLVRVHALTVVLLISGSRSRLASHLTAPSESSSAKTRSAAASQPRRFGLHCCTPSRPPSRYDRDRGRGCGRGYGVALMCVVPSSGRPANRPIATPRPSPYNLGLALTTHPCTLPAPTPPNREPTTLYPVTRRPRTYRSEPLAGFRVLGLGFEV